MSRIFKILITGSSGTVGRLVTEELSRQGHELVLIDKGNEAHPVDILKDPLDDYFAEVDIVIHLAAHPDASIPKVKAEENVESTRRVADAVSRSPHVQKVINASSINVYPYFDLYEQKKSIDEDTPLAPNLHFPPGEYARAKIEAENILKKTCLQKNVSLVNLRLGHVVPENLEEIRNKDELEYFILLSYLDVKKVAAKSLSFDGNHDYICVSNPSWFIGEEIRFPL